MGIYHGELPCGGEEPESDVTHLLRLGFDAGSRFAIGRIVDKSDPELWKNTLNIVVPRRDIQASGLEGAALIINEGFEDGFAEATDGEKSPFMPDVHVHESLTPKRKFVAGVTGAVLAIALISPVVDNGPSSSNDRPATTQKDAPHLAEPEQASHPYSETMRPPIVPINQP